VPSAVDPAAGYPDVDDLVQAYAESARTDVGDLGWYRAFAAYKLAVICEGIHYRYLAGETVGAGFERLGALVTPLAAHGLELP
jgi:aminoglycoside phosphotransferase (APT) family kinase protein